MKKKILFLLSLTFLLVSCNQDRIPKGEENSIVGLDVSHHNGVVDFQKWKKRRNVEFVFIKITEGVHLIDSLAPRHYKNAKKAGLYVGFYHYFRPQRSGKKQFAFMKRLLDKYDDYDLIPALDVEKEYCDWDHPDAYKNLDEFMESFYNHYGYYPILYTCYPKIFKMYPQCIRWGGTRSKIRKDIRQRENKKLNLDFNYCDDLSIITIPETQVPDDGKTS